MDLYGEGGAYGERGGESVDDLLHGTGMGPCRVSLAMREGRWTVGCKGGNLKRNDGRDIRFRSEIQAGKIWNDVFLSCRNSFVHVCGGYEEYADGYRSRWTSSYGTSNRSQATDQWIQVVRSLLWTTVFHSDM